MLSSKILSHVVVEILSHVVVEFLSHVVVENLSHVVVEILSHVIVEQRRTWIVNVDYGEAWINNVEQRRSMDK